MLKNISNLGKTLNKAEQQTINGGKRICSSHNDCGPGFCCSYHCATCVSVNNGEGLCNGNL